MSTWNILQNRSHTGAQISPQQVQKDRDHTVHIFRPQYYETRNQTKEKIWKDNKYWRLKNILLKNEWANQEVKDEIKKYIEANENDNTTAQNLWDSAKVVIRGKYIAIQAFLKKEERSQIYNLTLHLKELEKEQ